MEEKKYRCASCKEVFTEDDLAFFKEVGEAYHREKGLFLCPDCYDDFNRLTLEGQAAFLLGEM